MQTYELWLVVKGDMPIRVEQLPMVRISLALSMSTQEFLESDTSVFVTGLAFALGIDMSTIRVTGYAATGARRRLTGKPPSALPEC